MFKGFINKQACEYWLSQGKNCEEKANKASDFRESDFWFKRAAFAYEKAKQANYYCSEAWYKLGSVYMDINHFEEAIKNYTKLLNDFKIEHKRAEVYLHRGLCFYNLNKKNEAILDYWSALHTDGWVVYSDEEAAGYLYDLLKRQKTLPYDLLKNCSYLPGRNIMMLKCAQIMGPNRRVNKVVGRFKNLIFKKDVRKW